MTSSFSEATDLHSVKGERKLSLCGPCPPRRGQPERSAQGTPGVLLTVFQRHASSVGSPNGTDCAPCSLLPKGKESLSEELHELKKENQLLKEKNALVNRKKERYECEIKRLNKVRGRSGWEAPLRPCFKSSVGRAHVPVRSGSRRCAREQSATLRLPYPRGSARLGKDTWRSMSLPRISVNTKWGEILADGKNGFSV